MMRRKLQTGRGSIAITLAALFAEAFLFIKNFSLCLLLNTFFSCLLPVAFVKHREIGLLQGNVVLKIEVLRHL